MALVQRNVFVDSLRDYAGTFTCICTTIAFWRTVMSSVEPISPYVGASWSVCDYVTVTGQECYPKRLIG